MEKVEAEFELDPWLGFTPHAKLRAAYDQVGRFLDGIQELERSRGGNLNLRKELAFDRLPRVAVPLVWQEVAAQRYDRCASAISGPLFTSDAFPWPHSKNGGYCEPLLQIDTGFLSSIVDVGLGEFLIQVWMDDLRGIVRRIPTHEVRHQNLTPVSNEIQSYFSHGAPSDQNVYREWSPDTDMAPWLKSGYSFVGFNAPVHEFPETLDHFFDEMIEYGVDEWEPAIQAIYPADAPALIRKWDKLELLDHYEFALPAKQKPDELKFGQLFGRFRSVQSGPYDYFDGDVAFPLIDAGDYESIFYWGYGDAQLLTAVSDPGTQLIFDWSTS